MSSVLTEKSQLAVRMPTGSRPEIFASVSRGTERQIALRLARQGGVRLVDPGMDADLVAVIGQRAHLFRMQQRGDGRIEEACRNRLRVPAAADAGHGLAGAVLALTDAHRAHIAIAQRDRFVIRVEADRDRAARPIGPGFRLHAATGAGSADDLPPGWLGPLPWFAIRMPVGHAGFPSPFPPGIVPMLHRRGTHHPERHQMPGTDPALLSAEEMLTEFARRRLTPVDVLQAVTERVARLNPP